MKIKITKWKSMTWCWLNREELEGKELEVIKVVESGLHKVKKAYLIKEPNRYVSARDCIVVSS